MSGESASRQSLAMMAMSSIQPPTTALLCSKPANAITASAVGLLITPHHPISFCASAIYDLTCSRAHLRVSWEHHLRPVRQPPRLVNWYFYAVHVGVVVTLAAVCSCKPRL